MHHGSGTRASWWPSKPRVYILGLGWTPGQQQHQERPHTRHVVFDHTWGKRIVTRSTGQNTSCNRYDRQRQSMQSCTSVWHCHDGAHGQHPQMKQSRRSRVWQDSRQDAPARCLARRDAMTAMAYESVHYQSVPEAMRYQRVGLCAW